MMCMIIHSVNAREHSFIIVFNIIRCDVHTLCKHWCLYAGSDFSYFLQDLHVDEFWHFEFQAVVCLFLCLDESS